MSIDEKKQHEKRLYDWPEGEDMPYRFRPHYIERVLNGDADTRAGSAMLKLFCDELKNYLEYERRREKQISKYLTNEFGKNPNPEKVIWGAGDYDIAPPPLGLNYIELLLSAFEKYLSGEQKDLEKSLGLKRGRRGNQPLPKTVHDHRDIAKKVTLLVSEQKHGLKVT